MRLFLAVIVGIIGGFILGIALSSFIGIWGVVLWNEPMGIKFLPYFTSFICAIIVPMIELKSQIRH
ncbi:DUF5957 family protein [Lederbergia galactosidilytica]|uniref:Uncharacterized protein n=1 Tax=Lederbergia galactosidilytica TaxID=217031 RepID=A0A0Q9Y7E6_9BACI|nr:DUF5957 family protein [Lederbergia galactosidilytica]KRG16757.1 hypothetical protein ACA29_04075 [Lederbergia galactosidilytica]MBP1916789.1 ABC-type antimicrobial peptide transport system permease subunit [Lederbergia galactosidilytica]OAK68531.1 hypothetical protein ABB05_15770 [Lederbergia galactosidilytica]